MIQINTKLVFALLFLALFTKSNAQNDCTDAIVACGNSAFTGITVTGIGIQELSDQTNTCSSQENNAIWLKIAIKKGGTLGFLLLPESADINEDFDFFIFGPNATCNALGQSIRCSTTNPRASNQSNNYTGMNENETDTSEGPGPNGNSFVKWLTVSDGDTYFLVIDRPIGYSNFSLQWTGTATFNDAPEIKIPISTTLNMNQCDTDGVADFSTTFDLTKNTSIIIGNQDDVIVTYHTELNDAIVNINPILNPRSFVNSSNPQTIYTRITNSKTDCFSTSEFTIDTTQTISFPVTESYICDDATDGDDTNGKAIFDLNKVTSEVFKNQDTSTYTINYYLSQSDADANHNELPQFFHNTTAHQQDIYIKAYSNELCPATARIKLHVNPLPQKIEASLIQCDTGLNPDGISTFNLSEANSSLTNNLQNLAVDFFLNHNDAINNTNPFPTTFVNTINPQTIVAKVTNTATGCYRFNNLTLKVNLIPEQTYPLKPVCDDDGLEDGIHVFDLNEANIPIANTQTIAYYLNSTDALLEQNAIKNPQNFINQTTSNQILYARVEDKNDCFGISPIELKVDKLPQIEITSAAIVCSNLPALFVPINAGILEGLPEDYTYIWSKNGTVLPEQTAYSIDINTEGNYTVEVLNSAGCSKVRTIAVTPSNVAEIKSVNITEMADINTVTVNVTGSGKYEYSLDNPLGPFQNSNFFTNVTAGIHDIFVNDKNGCGTISKTMAVIGLPKIFTPNNDGYNDYWSVKGTNATFNAKSIIYIFDRYGKLLKQITPKSQGWDGTFNGIPLPTDDYWYTVKLEDGREVKGHFSLKR
ncbi:T9SS type B sorting domain-containing protein [Flavobacterium limnophilum]|uniref:T9SS type B sorting domain-containing protein n=1 Tax=Flavobacterium limnophilum TaxID=3003262 RepID=UPI0024822951|nr:T9SS type B sorting domain-containing protein [Flavobacterium limnophilum]